jgi:hypothetical protein
MRGLWKSKWTNTRDKTGYGIDNIKLNTINKLKYLQNITKIIEIVNKA